MQVKGHLSGNHNKTHCSCLNANSLGKEDMFIRPEVIISLGKKGCSTAIQVLISRGVQGSVRSV